MNTAFWACLVISNVWSAADHPVLGLVWVAAAFVVKTVDRKSKAAA